MRARCAGRDAGALAVPTYSQTTTQVVDPRFFSQTGYRIDTDAFWNFFQQRGNVRTFGYPVWRTLPRI
jgi:hypothetical protein